MLIDVTPFLFPSPFRLPFNPSSGLATVATLDAANEYFAVMFNPPKTGNIVGVEFRVGAVTTGGTLEVRLETVDAATGLSTGTNLTNAAGEAVFLASDDNAWAYDGFGSGGVAWGSIAVTDTDILALKFRGKSGAVPNMVLAGYAHGMGVGGFPYADTNVSGSAAKNAYATAVCFALEYDDGLFYVPYGNACGLPVHSMGAYTWDNNDAQKEYGARLTPEVSFGFKALAVGGDFDRVDNVISVYDEANNVLANTATLDKDQIMTYGGGNGDAFNMFTLDTQVNVVRGRNYYIGVKPQASTNTTDLSYFGANSTALMRTFPGAGGLVGCYRATQGSGAWTIEDTRMPMIFPLANKLGPGFAPRAQSMVGF